MNLKYDFSNMLVSRAEQKKLSGKIKIADKKLEKLRADGAQGFFDLPYKMKEADKIIKLANEFKKKFSTLLVIGIGGSDLGARAVASALEGKKNRMKAVFIGDNVDPDFLYEKTNGIDFKKTLVCVISKSGETLETLANYLVIRKIALAKIGKMKISENFMAITELGNGALREMMSKDECLILEHPKNVGGRFSVLSNVGLFPAACIGADIKKLMAGARTAASARAKFGVNNSAAQFAVLHYHSMKKRNQNIHVLMPYSSKLKDFSMWWRQLWAESLGKRKGDECVGPTPIAGVGTTDQHSQIQLYNDGPNDKVITFIEVGEFDHDFVVPDSFKGIGTTRDLANKSFAQIIHASRIGTALALKQNNRPNGTIFIDKLDEESLGALFYTFELATAYMAELLGVNAFDEPGVKLGKKLGLATLQNSDKRQELQT